MVVILRQKLAVVLEYLGKPAQKVSNSEYLSLATGWPGPGVKNFIQHSIKCNFLTFLRLAMLCVL